MYQQKEQHLVGVGENYTMTTTDSTFKVNPSALPDCPWLFKDQKKGMVGIFCNNNIIIDLPVSDGYMIHDYRVTDLDFLSNGGVFTDHRFLYWNFLSHWNAVIQHTIIPHLKNKKMKSSFRLLRSRGGVVKRFCSLMYYQPLKFDQTKIIMKRNFKAKYLLY